MQIDAIYTKQQEKMRKEIISSGFMTDDYDLAKKEGFNACLDEILGRIK